MSGKGAGWALVAVGRVKYRAIAMNVFGKSDVVERGGLMDARG
jgi:hypothetical protein